MEMARRCKRFAEGVFGDGINCDGTIMDVIEIIGAYVGTVLLVFTVIDNFIRMFSREIGIGERIIRILVTIAIIIIVWRSSM
jgi:hypothetical protein